MFLESASEYSFGNPEHLFACDPNLRNLPRKYQNPYFARFHGQSVEQGQLDHHQNVVEMPEKYGHVTKDFKHFQMCF